jgi:KipI family sensor histidine kinase inhibitor
VTRYRPVGDAALLVEADTAAEPTDASTPAEPTDASTPAEPTDAGWSARLAAGVTAARLHGVTDVVPGARTVLLITEPGSWNLAELARVIEGLPLPGAPVGSDLVIELPVVYDGPDLVDVAELTGLPVAEVIARHQDAQYTVGWLGFAPGFGYLTGLDPALGGVPRLASPRLSVPPGSVAIAGGLAAVYPSASPGGWRLLGRTSVRLWDLDREPPSLLVPGQRVRFRGVTAAQPATDDQVSEPPPDQVSEPPPGPSPSAGASSLEVIKPGPLATIQDLGRAGLGRLGVPPSGAADAASLRLANALAGNPASAAGIELTAGQASFRCVGGARLAVTGAPAQVTIAAGTGQPAREISFGTAFSVPHGSVIGIGAPATGLRTYVAVAGGIDLPVVLGSRSSDLLSGLGGGPLRPGAVLPIGPPVLTEAATVTAPTVLPARGVTASLRLVPGPRLDWFGPDALAILCAAPYTVTVASNRCGIRLEGPVLPRASAAELASEGVVTGALQVPHNGQPILLLTDHPTVGGYPVIATVVSADLGLAAQLRPGQQIRFRADDGH